MTHKTHKTRYSDSSLYDEKCELCGATDSSSDNRLEKPCPNRVKMSKDYNHQDRLGRALQVGDCVAVPHHNGLMVAVIQKCSPKMIQISEVGKERAFWRSRQYYSKYPSESVKLDGPEVTMYLLKLGSESNS